MKTIRWLTSVLVLSAAACGLPTGSDPRVEAVHDPPNIAITNHGDRTIYYLAADQNMLALSLFAPCDDPDSCDRVRPGERAEVPYAAIAGYTADTETVVVFWWHLVPQSGGGFEPDSIRSEVVSL